jgi:inhibitor of KinA sporulation pathway (predicted exonuclease)
MQYIILDIEFNGRKFASEKPMEVIEIGAVRLDENLVEVDTFSALIKPIYFANLNSFIKKKTGIVQEEIDQAEGFTPVITNFIKWLDKAEQFLLITWGKEDIKRIIFDARMHNLNDAYWMSLRYFDMLKGYTGYKKHTNDVSVEFALNELEIMTTGVAHRALEDARNTSLLFKKLVRELDLSLLNQFKDTFSNSKERRMVKNTLKAFIAQGSSLEWDRLFEVVLKNKIKADEIMKLDELKQYFETEKESYLTRASSG